MNTAYCLKCKLKREMKDGEIKKTVNSRNYLSGLCIVCGCKMNKFLKKELCKIEQINEQFKKEDVI